MDVDPETEITVTCGATEGMIAAMLAVLDPGDEVVVFEPFYENYGPDAILSGADTALRDAARARLVDSTPTSCARAFTPRTRGDRRSTRRTTPPARCSRATSWSRSPPLCLEHDVLAITDDIYEHIIYAGRAHPAWRRCPAWRERTVSINSISKTYSVTGWRVGWVIAPPELSVGDAARSTTS